MNLELIGYAAASLTTVAFVPQAVKIVRSRDTRAISLWMYVSFTAGIALWIVYGVAMGSWPLILSNSLVLPLAATILAFKIRHG